MSQSTGNVLKRIEMQKKKKKNNITPLTQAAKRYLTYPMSPAGSQGVSMPIGLKLCALEGYTQTDKQSYFGGIPQNKKIELLG